MLEKLALREGKASSSLLLSKSGLASTIRGEDGEIGLLAPDNGGGISSRNGMRSALDHDASFSDRDVFEGDGT